MGISVEFNPDLCLRKYGTEGRDPLECLPKELNEDRCYEFLKKGQRNYWFDGEVPLRITEGEGCLSRPIASAVIMEATHCRINGMVWTKGVYRVTEVFSPEDKRIHFDGLEKIK